jgi:hypothetical protein
MGRLDQGVPTRRCENEHVHEYEDVHEDEEEDDEKSL